MKKIKIFFLKRKLKRLFLQIQNMPTYGMGNTLFDHVTGGRLLALKWEINATLNKLEKIDPTTPKTRLDTN